MKCLRTGSEGMINTWGAAAGHPVMPRARVPDVSLSLSPLPQAPVGQGSEVSARLPHNFAIREGELFSAGTLGRAFPARPRSWDSHSPEELLQAGLGPSPGPRCCLSLLQSGAVQVFSFQVFFLSMPLPGWFLDLQKPLRRIIYLRGWLGAGTEAEPVQNTHSCLYIKDLGLIRLVLWAFSPFQ